MRNLRFLAIFLILALAAAPLLSTTASALVDPSPGAEFVVLVETTSNQVLYAKNENARAYPASLTKIMTALLACEAIEDGVVSASELVTASDNARFDLTEDSSTANIVPGEMMAFRDLIYCALVKSANEACNIIAERISGSVSAFVELMNMRAHELGCTGTRYANTHGMPDEGHYTTAWDAYLIMAEALKHPLFAEVASTKRIEIPATNLNTPRILENTNALLGDSADVKGYTYEYAKNGKTGHTMAAGHCLVSSAVKNDIELIAVVMKAESIEREDGSMNLGHFSDSILLYNWAFESFSYQEIIKQTEVIATLPVAMGSDSDTVSVRPERSISVLLPNDVDAIGAFTREVTLYSEDSGEKLQAPIQVGAVLGEITLSKDGVRYGTIPLVSTGSVELSKSYYMMTQIKETLSSNAVRIVIGILALLLLVYIVLVIRYRVLRMRHRMSVRKARSQRTARETAGYAGNEYYAPQRRQQSRPAPPKEYIDIDNFDEDDYYEGEPVGRTPPPPRTAKSPDAPKPPEEPRSPEAPEPGDDGDGDGKSDRDFYEEFFK